MLEDRFDDRLRAVMMAFLLFASAVVATSVPAGAQEFGGAFEGMRDRNAPVEIEADRLEVVDQEGVAVFEGNVSVVQGSTLLKTRRLKVHYVGGSEGAGTAGGNVRRIEASGRVAVRSRDQMASADNAVVDMLKQVATLSGNVSISQGKNIVTGCLLTIDLATNAATLEPCKSADNGGRVKMLFTPKSGDGQ